MKKLFGIMLVLMLVCASSALAWNPFGFLKNENEQAQEQFENNALSQLQEKVRNQFRNVETVTFESTNEFDYLVELINDDVRAVNFMKEFGVERIGVITESGDYTVIIDVENGQIVNVLDGLSDTEFDVRINTKKIEKIVTNNDFSGLDVLTAVQGVPLRYSWRAYNIVRGLE